MLSLFIFKQLIKGLDDYVRALYNVFISALKLKFKTSQQPVEDLIQTESI